MQIIGSLLAAALAVSTVEGHAYVSNPLPRAKTIPGHFYQFDPQSDGRAFQNCRDGGLVGPVQVEWMQGQTVQVEVTVTAHHGGWHELRFCENAYGNNACYEGNLATVPNPANVPTCPQAAPGGSTHRGSCIPNSGCPSDNKGDCITVLGMQHQNYTFTLPPDLNCDHCGMQWWWITDNGGKEHFKSCHDVRIRPTGSGPSPTSSPPGQPVPSPTLPPPPPANCDIPIEYDTDFFGQDLAGMDAVDEFACCALCEANSQCASFTFVPSSVGWRQCYLKRAGATQRNTPGMISGSK